jgi:hypothetical protein
VRASLPLIALFVAVACSTANPTPTNAAATACPAIAAIRSFVAARDRADGASAAALFTSDGFIDGPVVNNLGVPIEPAARGRTTGTDQIRTLIDTSVGRIRSVNLTDGPQGCGAETVWTERRQPLSTLPAYDVRGVATVRDGKITSIVYTVVSR